MRGVSFSPRGIGIENILFCPTPRVDEHYMYLYLYITYVTYESSLLRGPGGDSYSKY